MSERDRLRDRLPDRSWAAGRAGASGCCGDGGSPGRGAAPAGHPRPRAGWPWPSRSGSCPGCRPARRSTSLAATAILGVLSALLRPLLTSLALLLGWAGVLLAGLCGQAAPVLPRADRRARHPRRRVLERLLGLLGVRLPDDRGHLGRDRGRQRRLPHPPRATLGAPIHDRETETPGVVFIQIDGLPAPLLRWGVRSGELPTLGRWIRSGSHRLADWHAQLPATTPASQAGLLHGRSDQVPAFRWYEKEAGRLLVANHPKDAAVIQSASPTGAGCSPTAGSASPTSSPATRRPAC